MLYVLEKQPEATTPRQSVQPSLWIDKILVPVDLGPDSAETVQYAAAMAREFHATVVLVHVVQLNIVGEERGVPRNDFLDQMSQTRRRQLEELANVCCGHDVASTIAVMAGRPHEEIVRAAQETNADLIIMIRRSENLAMRLLGPKTIARVLREAPCPVVVLRPEQQRYVLNMAQTRAA